MVRRAALLVAVALLAVPPLAAAQSAEPQTSLPDIEDEVMCIVCGVPLELATEAPQANQERDFIRELIAQGLTKDEIKDRLVAEFGSEVLATPDNSGFDLAARIDATQMAATAATCAGRSQGLTCSGHCPPMNISRPGPATRTTRIAPR